MSVQFANNYCQNVLLSEHTVTDNSEYNYLNTHHSVILISWQLYIMKLTVARHYKLIVQPCSNVTNWRFLYRTILWDIWFILTQIASLRFFWILSSLLTPLLVLKTISYTYSIYHSAGYRNMDIVFALLSSSLLPQYVLVFVCVLAKIFAVEKQ
jgi:hypothetical protein